MERSDSIAALGKALVAVQAELEPVRREHTAKIPTKSGGSYSYTYASLEDVFACSRHLLAKHGLAVTQLPCETSSGGDGLRTILLHESGEFIADVLPLRGQDATMQALGAAITYARRYGYQSAVGIAAEEDDDAAPAGRTQTATEAPQSSQASRSTPDGDEESRGDCPVHGVPFRHIVGEKNDKPYDFWSCPEKNDDGSWCKQKPPKVATPEEQSVLDSEPPPGDGQTDAARTALLVKLRKKFPGPKSLVAVNGYCALNNLPVVPNVAALDSLSVDLLTAILGE